MHSNWPILAKLFFSFVHLANEINESFSWLWHSLLRPIGKLELTNCPRLAVLEKNNVFFKFFYFIFNYSKNVIIIQMAHKLVTHPGICDFEFSEDVLGHVVLGHGIHHKVLIPGGALCRPVLVTLLLQEESTEASAQSFFFFFFPEIQCGMRTISGYFVMKISAWLLKFIIHLETVLCQMRYDAHGM